MLCVRENPEQRAIKAISKQIDKDLKNARRKLRTEKKLLLLGKFLNHVLPHYFIIFMIIFTANTVHLLLNYSILF